MNLDQLARRQRAADRHDDALRRWPDRRGSQFEEALEHTVRDLVMLIAEMPPDQAESVEWSRTHRWLADAYFDQARGVDRTLLERGRAVYRRAEQLLGSSDRLEYAKLLTNYANTLRALAGTEDRALAEDALSKYRLARSLFAQHEPHRVPMIDDLIGSLESVLAIWKARDTVREQGPPTSATPTELARTRASIEGAAKVVRGEAAAARRSIERLAQRAGVEVDTTELEGLLAALPTDGPVDPTSEILNALRQRFERDVAEGKVTPDRAEALRGILRRFQESDARPETDVGSLADKNAQLKELTTRAAQLAQRPSYNLPLPPADCRGAQVLPRWTALRNALFGLATRSRAGATTRQRARELIAETAELDRRIYVVGADDRAMRELERDRLRPVANEVRRLGGIQNLTVIAPDFDVGPCAPTAEEVFFAGHASMRELVAEACGRVGLRLQAMVRGEDHAHARWRQLRRANVGIFDFTTIDDAALGASVGYEFGLAQSIGLPMVVLRDSAPLPFDVAVTPIEFRGGPDDVERLADVLDDASYRVPMTDSGHQGVVATVDRMLSEHGQDVLHPGVSSVLRQVAATLDEPDPVAIESNLKAVLLQLGDPRLELVTAAWPASYPALGSARLFHVMPYRPSWARTVSEHVRATCGVEYVRHDAVDCDRIIHSMWEEVCRASHILVDISGLNVNVAIELGFAHALGKPTLVVAQAGSVDQGLFPSIAKRKIHEYRPDELASLSRIVERFVRIPSTNRPMNDAALKSAMS